MIHDIVRKHGIPALAHSPSDPASQWPCSLAAKFDRSRMQATISLQSSIPIHGLDSEQTFTLLYHADNLLPGNNSLKKTTTAVPQYSLDRMSRQGTPKLTTLSLALKSLCPLWCSLASGSIAPEKGFESSFHQLLKIARATEVVILFDCNWLSPDNQAHLLRLINHPDSLSGLPVDRNSAKLCRQVDWSALGPVEDVVFEAPPPYSDTSNKRCREARNSATPEPPLAKHLRRSPTLSFAPSPTEKATTASTPSPKAASSPVANAPNIQDAVERAVATLLPGVLQTILPDVLARMFASPALSPSPPPQSQTPTSPTLNPTSSLFSIPLSSPSPLPFLKPTPNPMSLNTLMSAPAAAHVETWLKRIEVRLQRICTDALDRAGYLHSAAEVEFHEALEDQKLDVATIKDDGIQELNSVVDQKLIEFEESVQEIIEKMRERAESVSADITERLEDLLRREIACLRRERELLERERGSRYTTRGRG